MKRINMKTSRIKSLFLALFTGSMLFLYAGCIKEDRSDCGECLTLKFRYVTSADNRSKSVSQEIDRLSVFVFDASGRFVYQANDASLRITDAYSLTLPLNPGRYQFIVWAGLDERYHLPACIVGKTGMQDFILQLERTNDHTIPQHPALLYHGIENIIEFKPMENKTVTIGLYRITNTIRVIAHNLDPNTNHDIHIEDDNGTYYHNREIAPDNIVTYIPSYTTKQSQVSPLIVDFNVMRLQTGRNPRLKIKDAGGVTRYDQNLISELLGANPYIDFDFDHDFTIEITFNENYIPVSIRINGWEIIHETEG